MSSGSDGKKKPYIPATATKLPFEKAKQFIVERTHCSDKEASDLLESLRQEQQRNKQPRPDEGNERKRSA